MKFPSVTEVLHAFGLYGDIERWSEKAARNRPDTDKCVDPLQRGRTVDGACNLLLMGKELTPEWRERHTTCCEPFVDGYRNFLRARRVKLVRCAYEVVNRTEQYCGHPDQRVMLDDRPALFDLKSGGMNPVTGLQLAAYLRAERDEFPNDRDLLHTRLFGLQLTRGDYKLHEFTFPFVLADEFILLRRAYRVKLKYITE